MVLNNSLCCEQVEKKKNEPSHDAACAAWAGLYAFVCTMVYVFVLTFVLAEPTRASSITPARVIQLGDFRQFMGL